VASRLSQPRDLDSLQPWARRALEQAYDQRPPRESDGSRRASREDFTAGFLAALVWLDSRSSFVDEVRA